MNETKSPRSKESASGASGQPSKSAQDPSGAQAILNQTKEVASQAVDQARGALTTRMAAGASSSAAQLTSFAAALRKAGHEVEGNPAAPWIGRAADQLERFSGTLEASDVRELVRKAEGFARREPLLFLGGAFAAGVLGARFLKSSAKADGDSPSFQFSRMDRTREAGMGGQSSFRQPGEWQP